MDRKWSIAGIAIILVLLIYSFITTLFRSDQKRYTHNRIYRDYSDSRKTSRSKYSRTTSRSSKRSVHPNAYKAAREAKKIKREMYKTVLASTITSYNNYMNKALKGAKSPTAQYPKPTENAQYKKVIILANSSVPEHQSGLFEFNRGNYDKALKKFSGALDSVDKMDIKHRIDIYNMIAECYLELGNDNGYIQYKIKQVRMERKLRKLLEQVFPNKRGKIKNLSWSSTQEASKRLLQIRSMASRVKTRRMEKMVRRAKLDLEVSRKVSR